MANQELVKRELTGEYREDLQESSQKHIVYAPCLNCRRHPHYPHIAPVTRHIEGICAICGTFSENAL